MRTDNAQRCTESHCQHSNEFALLEPLPKRAEEIQQIILLGDFWPEELSKFATSVVSDGFPKLVSRGAIASVGTFRLSSIALPAILATLKARPW